MLLRHTEPCEFLTPGKAGNGKGSFFTIFYYLTIQDTEELLPEVRMQTDANDHAHENKPRQKNHHSRPGGSPVQAKKLWWILERSKHLIWEQRVADATFTSTARAWSEYRSPHWGALQGCGDIRQTPDEDVGLQDRRECGRALNRDAKHLVW